MSITIYPRQPIYRHCETGKTVTITSKHDGHSFWFRHENGNHDNMSLAVFHALYTHTGFENIYAGLTFDA